MEQPAHSPQSQAARWALLLGLGLFLAQGTYLATTASVTWDEPFYVVSGPYYWAGDFRPNVQHPPLAKLILGLPNAGVERDPFVPGMDQGVLARDLMDRSPALLLRARLMNLLLGLVTLLMVAAWMFHWSGPRAAATAVLLLALEPTFVGHSALATLDTARTLGMVSLAFAAWWFHRTGYGMGGATRVGLAFGGLAVAKAGGLFEGLVLLAPWVLMGAWQRRRHLLAHLGDLAVMFGVGALIVLGAYGGSHIHHFWEGIGEQLTHVSTGHAAYFFGEWIDRGGIEFFTMGTLLKVPLFLLVIIILGMAFAITRAGLRSPDLWYALWPAVAVYALMTFAGLILGVRYVMPGIVFLLVLGTLGLARLPELAGGRLRVAVIVVTAFSVISWGPHPLAYYNELRFLWRPASPPLLDSTTDWGQDLGAVAREEVRRGPAVAVRVFSSHVATIDWHRSRTPGWSGVSPGNGNGGDWIAVSATGAINLWNPEYSWREVVDQWEPSLRLGRSVFVYELDRPQRYRWLEDALRREGRRGEASQIRDRRLERFPSEGR